MHKNQRVFARGQDRLLHPSCRKIDQMQRQMRHNLKESDAKNRQKAVRGKFAMRAAWLREQITNVCGVGNIPSATELQALATHFVRRHDEELNALRERRNPPQGQIKLMERFRQSEVDELRTPPGLEMPDVSTDEHLAALMAWDGAEQSATKLRRAPIRGPLRGTPEDEAVKAKLADFEGRLVGAATVAVKRAEGRGRAPPPATVATAELEAKLAEAKRATQGRAANVMAGKKTSAKAALGKVIAGAGTELRKLKQLKDMKARRHKQLTQSRGLLH